MKSRLSHLLSSFSTTLALLLAYASGLAAATLIEKYHGTPAARQAVYYCPLFFLLQVLLVANFFAATLKHKYLRRGRTGLVLTHAALIVILLGAVVSHFFSMEGVLHLREGQTANRIVVRTDEAATLHTLPFSVELERFTLVRYPGSASPSSYESDVVVHADGARRREKIYMNNVLDVEGYRFFQASYDPDECGTVLSVSRDVAGRTITYAGYLLLALGLVLSLLGRNSRFMQLSRRLGELRKAAPLALLLVAAATASPVRAEDGSARAWATACKYVVPREHAARFGALPMQSSGGRMMPVNTFSSEVLRKLHKAERIGGLDNDQFLLSLLVMPDVWMHVRFIAMDNADLSALYGLPKDFVAYADVFDETGNYKLQTRLEQAYSKPPSERTRLDKDLMKLDEQLNIFNLLVNHRMLNLFPREGDPDRKWYAAGDDLSGFSGRDSLFVALTPDRYLDEVQAALKGTQGWDKAAEVLGMIENYQRTASHAPDISPKRLQAELTYNRLRIFRTCRIGYLLSGGLLLTLAFVRLFRPGRKMNVGVGVTLAGITLFFLYHTAGMALRWYIGGYAPWSNSYETMVYVAWCTVAAGLLFARRNAIIPALATLFGGVILFVSGLNWLEPHITPLVPVLKSPWLMFHVAVVTAAYGFFGIGFLLGLANLVLMSLLGKRNAATLKVRIAELSIAGEMALWVGLALMTLGTFLGAVWANESWGRYWGWDPKETWALITMVVYAVVTHLHLARRIYSLWLFNLAAVVALASVLMTFFGVNYLLSGMHSYGQTHLSGGFLPVLLLAVAAVALPAAAAYRKRKLVNSNPSQDNPATM